jgi:carboxymethylenebutenolidase
MCDREFLAAMDRAVSRRQFAKLGAAATVAASVPWSAAHAIEGVTEAQATFDVPGGKMDTFFAYPSTGKHPGVIVWPDIAGLRGSFMSMARRLARDGFSVMVLNAYYLEGEAPQFDDFDDWREQGGMDKVAPWRDKLTPAVITETAKAVVAVLDMQESVDTAKGIGVQGYCMGGPFAVWTAAAVPERVRAVATFHGAGLVGEEETSPVKVLGQTQASYLFAIARSDDRTSPGDKDALRAAAAAAGRPAEIKVFPADHGWTVSDSPVYNYDQDDASWELLLDLYEGAL